MPSAAWQRHVHDRHRVLKKARYLSLKVTQIKGLRVAYLCCILRHEEQNGPCILKESRDIAHTASTHTGALSSRSRGCLLPAVLGVRCIPYRAMTGATHGAPLPPLGRRDPARMLARDDVARWGALHVVTSLS